MLWQQAVAAGKKPAAHKLAGELRRELRRWDREFNAVWSARNRATPRHCTPFIRWRLEELARWSNGET
jgi:hypothetical protein